MRKRVAINTVKSLNDLKEMLLDPEMIGMRLPKTDLDHLRDFSRVTLQANYDKEFKVQDNLVDKLESYLQYLVMVKFMSAWRPHQSM